METYPLHSGLDAIRNPKRHSLRAILSPLSLMSKAWGLVPLNLGRPDVVEGRPPMYSICAAIFLVATHLSAVYFIFSTDGPSHHHVRYVTRIGVVVFNRLCGIVNQLLVVTNWKSFASAVASTVALDEEWRPAQSEKAAIYVYVQLALMFCVDTSESLLLMQSYELSWPLKIYGVWENVASVHCLSLLILQWTNLVCSLTRHMDELAEELAQRFPGCSGTFTQRTSLTKADWTVFLIENEINQGCRNRAHFHKKSAQTHSNITSYRRHHSKIYDALQKLQAAYGGCLAIGFALVLVNTVVAVFEVTTSIGRSVTVDAIIWAVWKILLLGLMVQPCQTLLNRTQKCADILHSAMQNNMRPSDRKQLLGFSVQLLDFPLTCSSCGFFLLDNQKLMSVLGTVITYVIILRQFDSPDKRTIKPTNGTNCCATVPVP